MSDIANDARQGPTGRWAPWWAYLIAIALVNQARQLAIGRDAADWVNVVTAIPLAVAVFVIVTIVYRSRSADRSHA